MGKEDGKIAEKDYKDNIRQIGEIWGIGESDNEKGRKDDGSKRK